MTVTIVVWCIPSTGAPGAVNPRFAAYVEDRPGFARLIRGRSVYYPDQGKYGDQPDPTEADAAVEAIRKQLGEAQLTPWSGAAFFPQTNATP